MKREELPNETPREDLMREALKHYEELATKACWHRSDIPDAIRAYYTPLPPAEGAEAFIRAKIADHKLHDCYPTFVPEMAQAMTEFAAQQQPTAEGAGDILEKHMKLCSIQPINGGYPKFVVLVAMTEFAEQLTTLYAQRIADKMVEERLRDAFDAGMDYDRMIHGNCIDGVDFETWYNRLKSRESHDSKS